MVAKIAAMGKVGGPYWPYIASVPSLAPRNGIQHIPCQLLPDPDGGEWQYWNSPGQATREPALVDRDHRFSAGYLWFEKEGAVSQAGDIRSVLPGVNCDLEKSDPVACDRIKSPIRAIRIEGLPGSLEAI